MKKLVSIRKAVLSRIRAKVLSSRITAASSVVGLFLQFRALFTNAETVEQTRFEFTKSLENETNFDDTEVKEFTKTLNSVAYATDDLDGQATSSDENNIYFTKGRRDSSFFTDNISFSSEKALVNDGLTNDAIAIDLIRSTISLFSSQDRSSQNATKTFNDIYAIDYFAEDYTTQDTLVLLSESLLLTKQNYTDNAYYFAEDYVGSQSTV